MKIILFNYQNNYGRSDYNMKIFCSIAHYSFLHNYFHGPTKLFSDL